MKADWKNTAVVIPIFNSEKYLDELFERTFKFFSRDQVFAVNDASTDHSYDICRSQRVNLLNISENTGKGNALQIGFAAAAEGGFHFAFSIDSDLQHKPEDFALFLQKQNEEEADLVIGKRDFSSSKMPLPRICSNATTSKIVSIFSQQKILDSQSGFRLYNLDTIRRFNFRTKRFQFETEVILKIAKIGGMIDFVSIDTIYNGQKSYISHLRDIKNFVNVVLREALFDKK
ncbi:MAG TPA: glycosyltransferase family 2 protein [Candidatus Cloacimonadota bacterium]|nr:glycosyltransferase family 2 protein [Candidatus Cloacimonadota bacterium]